MKRRVLWIEFVIIMGISVVALFEAFRLILYKDPHTLYDILGPGNYVLALSIALMATSITYLVVHLRKPPIVEKEIVDKVMKFRLYGSSAALVIYLILINILGYLLASFIFFILEFRIVGIKSWPRNIILSTFLTGAFYFVFVKYCGMVFPRGIFGYLF